MTKTNNRKNFKKLYEEDERLLKHIYGFLFERHLIISLFAYLYEKSLEVKIENTKH